MRYRASPHIELKRLRDLSAEQREAFLELKDDPDFYGLFIPRPPLLTNLKSVSRQTATLFRKLAKPSPLTARAAAGAVDLVLDGILEVEGHGGFVFGADALPLLAPPAAAPAPRDHPARLSRQALLYAEDLQTNEPQRLSAALYHYNRIPLTPFWRTRFATPEAVLAHVGADRGALRALLERHWHPPQGGQGWLRWYAKARARRLRGSWIYKLYISPRPERIREVFEAAARVFATFPGTYFKIGDSAIGLLRPDKMVAYFTTRERLVDVADALRRELAGCDAHGVPFSAGFDDSGLLSWGVDPPETEQVLRWLGRDSWRIWLGRHLAAALSIAKLAQTPNAVEPWRFAIERARLLGVDVETWTPSATLWR
ncbi:MAG TPA: hypothetical protein VI670_00230 [Thermoanaerobaculia bacterium]|jgi:hypothetical protein